MLKLDKLPDYILEPQSTTTAPAQPIQTLVRQAFESPVDYPAVQQWLFPGDAIAIVLQANLPQPVEVLESLLDYCVELKIDLNDVTVVINSAMARPFGIAAEQLVQTEAEIANGEPPEIIFVAVGSHKVGCQVHDPANTYGLAYLAANEAGDPVHVNRLLVDADVVIPVGCPTPGGSTEPLDCIYPDFGSASRLSHFLSGSGSLPERAAEVKLANENLGSFFLMQIVSAPGGSISDVVAGSRPTAIQQATELANQHWTLAAVPNVEIVIATIEETGREHSWNDFANALIAAAEICGQEGPIVVWSSIEQSPDRNTRKALQTQFEETDGKKLSRVQRKIAAIVAERPVFLRSELPESSVEELGIGCIVEEADVVRIAGDATTGLLLRDAHKVCIERPSTPQPQS